MTHQFECAPEASLPETIGVVDALYERSAFTGSGYIRTLLIDDVEQDRLRTADVPRLAERLSGRERSGNHLPYTRLLGLFAVAADQITVTDIDQAAAFHRRHSVFGLDNDTENIFYRLLHGSNLAIVGTDTAAREVAHGIRRIRNDEAYREADLTLNDMGRSQGGSAHNRSGHQLAAGVRTDYHGSLAGRPLRIGGLVH